MPVTIDWGLFSGPGLGAGATNCENKSMKSSSFVWDFFLSRCFCLCEMSSHGANTSPEVQQKAREKQQKQQKIAAKNSNK